MNEQRRECAKRHRELLRLTDSVVLPVQPAWSAAVYHLYVVRVEERTRFQQHLAAANIGTAIHYPVPLHLQNAYLRFGYQAEDFPIEERCTTQIVSLPIFPGLRDGEQRRVAECVQSFVSHVSAGVLVAQMGSVSY